MFNVKLLLLGIIGRDLSLFSFCPNEMNDFYLTIDGRTLENYIGSGYFQNRVSGSMSHFDNTTAI